MIQNTLLPVCVMRTSNAEGCPFIMGVLICVDMLLCGILSKMHGLSGKDFKTVSDDEDCLGLLRLRPVGWTEWLVLTNILGTEMVKCWMIGNLMPKGEKCRLSKPYWMEKSILNCIKYLHKVRINYYPPRMMIKRDDNIDIYGWMGYPMQIKVDFLCKDSILLLLCCWILSAERLASRAGWVVFQTWLSFHLKSPMHDFEPKRCMIYLNNLPC